MSNDEYFVMAQTSGTFRDANDNIVPTAYKVRHRLRTSEEAISTVFELWNETQLFIIVKRDERELPKVSESITDNKPCSSKEDVGHRIEQLFKQGAVEIWACGGKSTGGTTFLAYTK